MSHAEKMEELFKEMNLKYEKHSYNGRILLKLGEDEGYLGFGCTFSFDKEGKFQHHAIDFIRE